ncbi:hypothetical protein [Streptomyces sp. NPDC051569]|uniref:hypothetical protein n=1 Tax=Streptomyces sp. NPDC051569 TaxID=3365661 RepID=UPI0037A65255
MILVVEGPGAVGRTTYCRAFPRTRVVEELGADIRPAAGLSLEETCRFWVERNEDRWSRAVHAEGTTGMAVCDTDPLKLHHSWSLARTGLLPPNVFRTQLRHTRAAMADGRLGMADLVACRIPTPEALRRQRDGDRTRGRRDVEVDIRLAGALREWYEALDVLAPGRVRWDWPASGDAVLHTAPCPGPLPKSPERARDGVPVAGEGPRHDIPLLDTWMRALPELADRGPRG